MYIFDENYNLLHSIDSAAASRVGTGDSVNLFYDEYYFDRLLDPLVLLAGTTYYLGIANADSMVQEPVGLGLVVVAGRKKFSRS